MRLTSSACCSVAAQREEAQVGRGGAVEHAAPIIAGDQLAEPQFSTVSTSAMIDV